MASRWRGGRDLLYFILLCHGVSFLLFCRGFMLKRVVIPEYSQCLTPHGQDTAHSCHSHPRPFKRVLWLLIDALRYDFMVYDNTLNPVPVYRNKMPYVRDLLDTRPANARLFKFIADPPTTTMQRLKALTTGSLPTFIDIGSNFNSYAVSEDSLPHQAKLNSRNVTFIGDDTWLGLYPDMLTKMFDYPSLNVQDLDTVDNGVMENLGPELRRKDAELVIGHMLGVDHVGHTYGPSHWTMGEKLTQMNGYLRHVFTDLVDEDTVVFVFGDHGMSPTGDHGGETSLETDAALLVYSPRPLFDPSEPAMGREVYQVDLVPTTAMVIGLPIPFSNLGTVIPEVLLPFRGGTRASERGSSDGFSGRVTTELLEALRVNALQLYEYLKTYAEYSQDFPGDVFRKLETDFRRVSDLHRELLRASGEESQSQHQLTFIASEYFKYTREVKAMCQSIWAKFDNSLMNQGLGLLALTVVASPLMLLDVERSSVVLHRSVSVGVKIGLALTTVSAMFAGVEVSLFGMLNLVLNCALVGLVAILVSICLALRHTVVQFVSLLFTSGFLKRISLLHLLPYGVIILHAVSMLSNSFILYEADMLAFFIQSLVFGLAVRAVWKVLSVKHFSFVALFNSILPHFSVMVCVRLSKLFYACRDLQIQDGCEATTFILSSASAREFIGLSLSLLRSFLSAVGLCGVVILTILHLRRMSSHKLLNWRLVVSYQCGCVLSVVCVIVHWTIQALPQSVLLALPHWQHVTAPRLVYVSSIAVLVMCVVYPFKKPVYPQDTSKTERTETASYVASVSNKQIPRQRNKAPDQVLQPDPSTGHTPSPTLLDATSGKSLVAVVTVILVMSLWIPIAMVLNDGIALSAVLSALQVVFVLRLLQYSEEGVSFETCVLWALLSCHSFFSYGHHVTVTSLRFEAGFVGIHGEINKYNLPLAATLVGLNTIAAQLLFGLGFPLVLLAVKGGKNLSEERGQSSSLSQQLLPPMVLYCVIHSFKLLVTMLAASLHRRHLMVWWVFAPRFLYEGAFQATTDISVLLASYFIGRLESVLTEVTT